MNTDNKLVVSQYMIIAILGLQVLLSVFILLRIQGVEQGVLHLTSSDQDGADSNSVVFVAGVSPDDDPAIGPVTAPVMIVEFGDFECRYCARSVSIWNQLMREYPDQIHLVYRDFPLESIHPHALAASLAAECADEQGHFWEMHDMLFSNQEALDVSSLEAYARRIGLDMASFSGCLTSQRYLEEVQLDVADGRKHGVRGTPTFFVNGYRLTGPDFTTLEHMVNEMLSAR